MLSTSGLTIDERSLLLMVNGSLYLHEWDGAAVLARLEEAQAPHAQKDRPMPNVLIDSKALQNLRRDAARAAPRASKPAPKADPHRAEKLKLLAKAPAELRKRLLEPRVSIGTVRAMMKALDAEAGTAPPQSEGVTYLSDRAEELDRKMGITRDDKPPIRMEGTHQVIGTMTPAQAREFRKANGL